MPESQVVMPLDPEPPSKPAPKTDAFGSAPISSGPPVQPVLFAFINAGVAISQKFQSLAAAGEYLLARGLVDPTGI